MSITQQKRVFARMAKSIGTAALLGMGFLLGAQNQEAAAKPGFKIPSPIPGKICILITDVGTADTVAKTEEFLTRIKEFNTESMPKLSEGDRAANPNLARQEVVIRYHDEVRRYSDLEREIAARNRRMEAILTQLRNSILANRREIVFGKNYLQSYLQPYSEYIQVIDRSNASLAEVEKAIAGNDQQDVASACFFMTVIMQDIQEESNTVQVGNTMVKRTNYTQKAVANVRDFNGNVILACDVVATSTFRQTSATRNKGHNPASDLMENALKQIAQRTAAHFLCKLKLKCVGPKGDENFDPDTVVFQLDGKEFENGSTALTGEHVLVAQADGYMKISRRIQLKRGAGERTIVLKFKPEPPKQPAPAPAN